MLPKDCGSFSFGVAISRGFSTKMFSQGLFSKLQLATMSGFNAKAPFTHWSLIDHGAAISCLMSRSSLGSPQREIVKLLMITYTRMRARHHKRKRISC